MSTALIQLISEQPLPNLLPLLAFHPHKAWHIVTNERMGAVSQHIAAAAAHLKLEAHIVSRELPHPTIEGARLLVTRLIQEARNAGLAPVVNFTGGLKPMSIGAYLAARDTNTGSIYCDTPRAFDDGLTGPLPACATLPDAAARLDVRSVLVAHGLDAGKLRAEKLSDALFAFGRCTEQLRRGDDRNLVAGWQAELRKALCGEKHGVQMVRARAVLATPLECTSEAIVRLLTAASDAGIVRREGTNFHLNPTLDTPNLRPKVERNFTMLEGQWFELAVADRMKRGDRFSDIRWSVRSDSPADAAGETDIVAFDRQTLALTFVSCKCSDRHVSPLEHVFATRQRALAFGGTFANCVFVFHAVNETRDLLVSACRAVRATLCEVRKEDGAILQVEPSPGTVFLP